VEGSQEPPRPSREAASRNGSRSSPGSKIPCSQPGLIPARSGSSQMEEVHGFHSQGVTPVPAPIRCTSPRRRARGRLLGVRFGCAALPRRSVFSFGPLVRGAHPKCRKGASRSICLRGGDSREEPEQTGGRGKMIPPAGWRCRVLYLRLAGFAGG